MRRASRASAPRTRSPTTCLTNLSMLPGFGGHAGITAFFVDTLTITNNYIQTTAYNGINLGWGWSNFPNSTTCKNNAINNNRLINTLSRLHDSGAVYTLGQMPGTTVNQNYVKGIPPNTSGPTYGLHNDEGSAFITENDNVLDIEHRRQIRDQLRELWGQARSDRAAHVRHGEQDGRQSTRPARSIRRSPSRTTSGRSTQYTTCLTSGIQDGYRSLLPSGLLATQDFVFPASASVPRGTATIGIRSSGSSSGVVWFAPAGTTTFLAGANMTKAAGDATSIAVPTSAGTLQAPCRRRPGQEARRVGRHLARQLIGGLQ